MRAALLFLAGFVAGICAWAAISAAGIASVAMATAEFGGELVVAAVMLVMRTVLMSLAAFGVVASLCWACGVIESPTPTPEETPDV